MVIDKNNDWRLFHPTVPLYIHVFIKTKYIRIIYKAKASDEAILQNNLFLGVSPGKSYLLLQNFENTLLENLICSYCISFSWKVLCVLTKFWTRSPGNFDLFLWYFFLLENRMCSCRILRKLSWKFWCVLVRFASPGKFICVLVPFLVVLENLDVFL